jgi:2,5-diamino-6-(ribosylamino)-4(3H)-pyrimidinone 5'-phosphate reductase
MRPYIICHMLSSIDGRIDGASLRDVMGSNDYELTGSKLKGDAWACGRTTMQLHFADKKPFVSKSRKLAGPKPVHVARRADSYAVSIDTLGKLRWSRTDIGGDHLICVVSERAREDYLTDLRTKGISYIVAGRASVDLAKAVNLLGKNFGIKTLLLEGGGNINGGFLDANLVDELSLLLAPGIDGRREIPTVFDGVNPRSKKAVPLKLISVRQRKSGILWIRYTVIRKRA